MIQTKYQIDVFSFYYLLSQVQVLESNTVEYLFTVIMKLSFCFDMFTEKHGKVFLYNKARLLCGRIKSKNKILQSLTYRLFFPLFSYTQSLPLIGPTNM